MNRSHTLRMAAGYVVAVALLGGALTQVPWTTLAATVGLAAPTYDQAAVAATAGSADRAGVPAVATSARRPTPLIGPRGRGTGPWRWLPGTETSTSSTSPRQQTVPSFRRTTYRRWAGGTPAPGPVTASAPWCWSSTGTAGSRGAGRSPSWRTLPLGSRVTLDGETYRLDRLTTYPKGTLPAQRVFGQRGPERLVVVTCGGSFSTTRGWDSNVVASFGLDPA